MTEEDLHMVGHLFDRAKENFERDGYPGPVVFAWASNRAPTLSLIGPPGLVQAGGRIIQR